jgi:hypothetical protein
MTTNSRGLEPDPAHLDEKAKNLAFIKEMNELTNRRHRRRDKSYTEDDAAAYRALWAKYYGPLKYEGAKPEK